MKAVLTFLAIIILWLNATACDSILMKQKQKEPAKQKTAVAGDTNTLQTDSISSYSINVNGRQNSVQITNDTLAGKKLEKEAKQKNKPNSIDMNGEGNSVNIHQSKNGGHVNIQQNGNGNKVCVSQTNRNAIK